MEIISMKIAKYRSIITEQEIRFSDQIITFVGQNGTGKSNVLLAIQDFFLKSMYRYTNIAPDSEYSVRIKLSDEDLNTLSPVVKRNDRTRFMDVTFNMGEPEVKRIFSPAINTSIAEYRKKLDDLFGQIQTDADQYIKNLLDLDLKHGTKNYQKIENLVEIEGLVIWDQDYKIKSVVRLLRDELKRMKDFLNKSVKDDYVNLNTYERYDLYHSNIHDLDLNIKIRKIKLTNLEKKYIKINMQKFKEEVDRINSTLHSLTERIKENYYEFQKTLDLIDGILDKDYELLEESRDIEEKEYSSFIEKVKSVLYKDIFLLDNENTLIFGNQYYKRNQYRRQFPIRNPIEYSFYKLCLKEGIIKGKFNEFKLSKLDGNKKEELREKFEEFIANKLPKFDLDSISKIEVIIESDAFKLNIIEKDGKKIDFNDTSLGRRWYFSYFFIKEILSVGDYLLIDEPAAFLHPDAQLEVLDELDELVKKGINVIICTHSPYMISKNINSFHAVSINEEGTIIEFNEISKLMEMYDNLGVLAINELILNIDKKIILVEGMRDVACLKAFMKILEIKENKYDIMAINGHPKYSLIIEFLKTNNRDYIQLMDYDAIDNHPNASDIIYVGEGTREKSIEGLFSKQDKYRYFDQNLAKIDIIKIQHATTDSVDEETYENFKKLFIKLQII